MIKMLAVFVLAAHLLAAQSPILSRGWFDIQKGHPRDHFVAVGSAGNRLVISIANPDATYVVVYGPDFAEVARWTVQKPPHFISTGSGDSITLWFQSEDSRYTACQYSVAGKLIDHCRTGTGWPFAVLKTADKTIAVTDESYIKIEQTTSRVQPNPVRLSRVFGEGPPLAAVSGSTLFRLDGTSLAASVADIETGEERTLVLSSPTLIRNQQGRRREVLAANLLGRNDGFLLAHGRYNVFTGLTLDKFSKEGLYVGALALQVPQFPELKRGTGTSGFGNPTGHMDTRVMVGVADRIVIVDPTALRVAWFDI